MCTKYAFVRVCSEAGWDLGLWRFQNPMGQFFDFLLLLVEKLKITFSANLIKSPKMKCCGFVRFILEWSNADNKSLSSGCLNKRAVSITCLRQIWIQTRNASFLEIFGDSLKMWFWTFQRGKEENQNFGPMGFQVETVMTAFFFNIIFPETVMTAFFFNIIFPSDKEKQKMWTQTTDYFRFNFKSKIWDLGA